MEKYISDFSKHLQYEKTVSPHTLRNYISDIEHFAQYLKQQKKNVTSVNNVTIRNYLGNLHKNLKKSSIARKLSAVRIFIQYLVREKIISTDVTSLISAARQEKKLPLVLDIDEIFHFLETPDISTHLGKRDRAILELMYATGVRVSELTTLDLFQISMETSTLKVLGKGKKERVVPFGEKAKEALQHYLTIRTSFLKKGETSPAFFLSHVGTRLTSRSVARMIDKYVLMCGNRRKIHPHAIRHTFATHLLSNGANLRDIQELLGHESLSTTQKYTQVSITKLMEEYDKSHPKARN